MHEYQRYCVAKFIECPELPLFLAPGLGKTRISLTALEGLKYMGLVDKTLIIAPLRPALNTWKPELEKWNIDLRLSLVLGSESERLRALEKDADLYVINVDNIVWLVERFRNVWPFESVVIDEISKFKNPGAKRFRAMRQIRSKIRRLVGLTGSPAAKGLIDLWAQMYLIDRGERLEKHVTTYRKKYFTPGRGNGHIVYDWILKPGADKLIQDRISDIAISMGDELLDLPARTDNVINLVFDGDTKARYQQFVREKVIELGGDTAIVAVTAAVLSGKLLQFTSGAVYDTERKAHEFHAVKLDALKELTEELQCEPLIIYYAYRHELHRIRQAIPEAVLLTDENLSDFRRGDIPILLTHPKSSGHGLDGLQDCCSKVCWYTLPNGDFELYDQANKRVDRQGQKRPVQIHHLMIEGTWDERALDLLQKREKNQTALLDAVKTAIAEVMI
jgi:SNF2 family DNA or RNA helicase